MNKQKIIAFDLDDVICFRLKEYEYLGIEKYDYCEPDLKIIGIINSLYAEGHTILIYTARGMSQCKGDVDKIYELLYDKTVEQLILWEVKYHKLIMGKIHYDVLIDDKSLNSNRINKNKITNFLFEKNINEIN